MEEPEELTFQFLREITEDFSEERKVGEGAFGKVYKGVTKHGEDVAVKILRDVNPDLDYRQFRNEFYNLTKAKHDNIVQFIGYCYETEKTRIEYNGRTVLAEKTHRALCFEFVHNGSLQKHLSDESCGLDWHTRYRIIKGTCEGLKYIHEDMGESLLHLDLKPDNILLDKNMVPKISDFGLSRIFGDELTRTTRSPLGTIGYQPPEYIERGEISEKFDIFSLGVVILSIVVGPNGYSKYLNKPLDEFIDQVQRNWRKRWQVTCSGDLSFEACCCQVETCTQIALDCLEKDNKKRPDIVKIIKKLNKIETGIDKLPQKRRKTVSGMTMHNEMKRAKKHKMISDQHQHSNFMIRSKRNESESNNTKETSLDVEKELIVGREEKKKRMASSLESMSEKIVILPIYGIGGIGKTTFARLIYNDKNFKYYSQVWVYVSPRFDLCKIGNSIISQLSGEENQANELQLIKSRLTKLFSRKKILIVLDDLWENNTIQLEDLKDMLTPGDKTIVLVTTRSAHIAQKICSNIEPYKIESLSDEMCWNIIKQKSGFEATHENEELVGIGKEIARKCGGVALAAQTLGSMLQSMKYDEWMTVKDSDIWNETISEDTSLPNHVLASLKLSYAFSMDDYLKSCFTYCAIFPKGYKIIKYDLIYQWISLGFIKPTKILSTLQLSEKYIEHLLGLTFLQHSMSLTTYRMYGEHDTVFTMHDLVHDLAISLLGDNILDQSKQGNTRGSSFCYALLTDCSKPLESCTASPAGLRALRFLDCRCTELHGAAFEPAESLRVLDLSECSVQKLPSSICRLKQLRYLNAPRIRDQFVPECITTLSNLRYLSLCGSFAILALPESIGEMEGLVHLDLSGCMGIEKLPESFVDLKSLEHLDFTNCKNVTGVSQCLARLTKLQYLNLSNCKNIGHIPGALGCLTELRYLNLSDCSYLSGNKFSDAEFLGSLTKLKYLNLYSRNQLHIIRLPEALGRLTELKYLNLSHHCSKGKLPASFGNLRNLVHLDLSWCSFHQDVAAVLNGLTTLQYLDLSNCSGFYAMEGKLEVFGNLSELRYLKLGFCNELIRSLGRSDINCLLQRICTLTNLEYLDLCGNNNIFSIPETLSNLRKLHTLDLSFCTNLQRLPTSISEIDSLKFLYTMECRMLDQPTVPQCKMASGISPYDYVIRTGDGKRSYPFKWKHEKHLGRLKITKLENVRSAKEVAQAINLMKSEKITGLTLKWTKDAERFMDDAEILKELDPPYRISEFRLQGYNSVSFPSWLMPLGAYLPRLVSIAMWDLPNCNHLPPLGQLPNLEWLEIRGMDSIKKIDADLYGGTPAFPRLVHFRIHYMESLEEWDTAYPNNDDGLNEPVFPCLISAEIRYCPRLSFKPRPPRSIKTLLVDRSEVMLTSSWENRGHVSASAATRLQVECCAVPLHQWSLLHHLPSLQHLRVLFCSDLTCSSPDFLGGLTSLQSLTVKDCGRITSLPERLGDLASLTKLKICDCKGIKSLPDTIQKLTCLLRLEISECPELVRWSESEENKMKLTHIEQRVFVRNYDGSGTDGESENEGFEVRTMCVRGPMDGRFSV